MTWNIYSFIKQIKLTYSTRIFCNLIMGRWRWWLHLIITVAGVWTTWCQPVPLSKGCSSTQPKDTTLFVNNRDTALSNLRRQVSAERKKFAKTEVQTSTNINAADDRVFAIAQCRKYLSDEDCLACYNAAAVNIIRNCTTGTGARVSYDGCFLR